MKYFIVIACFGALALVQADSECSGENLPKVRPVECCIGTMLANKNDFDECQRFLPITIENIERDDTFRRGGSYLECYMNQTGILKNGQIDPVAALTQITKSAAFSLRFVIKSAIDTCIREEFQNGGKLISVIQGPKQVLNPQDVSQIRLKAYQFIQCVEIEVYELCPAAQKVTSDECNKMSTFLANCRPDKRN